MPEHSVPKVGVPHSIDSWGSADRWPPEQLNDQSLFKQECYVNGEWIKAKSGKTFEVTGTLPREARKILSDAESCVQTHRQGK